MNFDNIFDKFRGYADVAMDKVGKASKTAASKTENVVSRAKIRFSINEANDKIDEIYKLMGKRLYEQYLEDLITDSDFVDQCKKIDELNKDIDELNSELTDLRAVVKCEYCGVYNKIESTFCSKCGAKLTKTQEPESGNDDGEEVIEVDIAED